MAAWLRVLGESDEHRARFLVEGYIRKIQKKSEINLVIPNEVKELCWHFSFFIFLHSTIIKDQFELDIFFNLLSKRISTKRIEKTRLLFRATRDNQLDYHTTNENATKPFPYDKLTNKGPYLFVIESSDGYVFGGYTAVNIVEYDKKVYLQDLTSFLFVLKGVKSQKPALYGIRTGNVIYYDGIGCWWMFGPGGVDLALYPKLDRCEYHFCGCNSNDNLRYRIPPDQSLVGTKTRYQFRMKELEIFSVPD